MFNTLNHFRSYEQDLIIEKELQCTKKYGKALAADNQIVTAEHDKVTS